MKNAEKYLGFNDLWLIIIGIPIISVIVNLMLFGTDSIGINFGVCALVGLLYVSAYWLLSRSFLIYCHKKYDDYQFTARRLLFVIFWMLVIFFVVKFVLGFAMHAFYPTIHDLLQKDQLTELLTTGILLAGMFFLYEGIYYFNKSKLIEIEKNKLERITAEQKLSTLKNQVNPHFLFNSLNTLVTIIPDEPELAIKFVQELSKSYRKILEVRDEKLITLSKELESLESYIYLLKTRFHQKLEIINTLDEDIKNQFILPLSLQILIENAVKHNITSAKKPLKIKVYNQDDFVVVENNLQRKDQNYGSTKLGLANIKSRYQLLINRNIVIEESSESFKVKLPIIKNNEHENSNH